MDNNDNNQPALGHARSQWKGKELSSRLSNSQESSVAQSLPFCITSQTETDELIFPCALRNIYKGPA